ncbi:hypothetical protein [Dyella sp. ASV21]|uniref:hypothetical protein n=1 Tax=Dyella sp. ASV21 TaxID=2795114 RepID=UPI0018EBD579|nr:hypothetical protein [Dyella sp. ASV21]
MSIFSRTVAGLAASMAFFSAESFAVRVQAIPNSWTMQSYGGVAVALWNTGSTCNMGLVEIPPNESEQRSKLLWSTVLAARVAQLPVFVDYEVSSGHCYITTFGIPPA